MISNARVKKVLQIAPDDDQAVEEFLRIRDRHYRDDSHYYSQTDLHRILINYYSRRSDYQFTLLVGTDTQESPARCMVGRCERWPWAFFGLFECPNDDDTFNALMDKAVEFASEHGHRRLIGPIDFNGIHNWQFLLWSQQSKPWVGDPYHHSYYIDLFKRNHWRVAEQSISGIVKPEHHASFVNQLDDLQAKLEDSGHELVTRHTLDDEEWTRQIWRLTTHNFDTEMLKYNPLDLDFFRQINQPILAMLNDPHNLIGTIKDGELSSFALSYGNFIDHLTRHPRNDTPTPAPVFAVKTIAVDKQYHLNSIFSVLLKIIARHCQERYSHPLGWRRTNTENPGTQRVQRISHITQRYCSFYKEG